MLSLAVAHRGRAHYGRLHVFLDNLLGGSDDAYSDIDHLRGMSAFYGRWITDDHNSRNREDLEKCSHDDSSQGKYDAALRALLFQIILE